MSAEWDAMDAWCEKRSGALRDELGKYILSGGSYDNLGYCVKLGRAQAYAAMRSFIHGARNAQGMSTRRDRSAKRRDPKEE